MIAKNIKGKGFAGCVRYVLNDTHELLEAEGVLAESAESIIRSFACQRSMRGEIVKPVGHIPISFAPEDKLRMTNDFMLQLAKEYMQEMGIAHTQYIVVRHHNTSNDHLHIVYNRIDNDLNLISVNNDYKRNIEVCKKLKDKHGLTYGTGKERVRREKLNHPDKAKYKIYDAVLKVLPLCKDENDLKELLLKSGIETEFKLSRTTGQVQGISFSYKNISFKGSQVDRKLSFANLKKEFSGNVQAEKQQPNKEQLPAIGKPKEEGMMKIGGVPLTPEQINILKQGGYIYLENMTNSKGKRFSTFVFTDDRQQRAFMTKDNPDTFVKYGQYEMRIRDKRLIEAGYVVKATVKWYGGWLAYPYLWKPDAVKDEMKRQLAGYELVENCAYCLSWGDPGEKAAKTVQASPRNTPLVGEVIANVGKSAEDVASSIGGLFDIQPSLGGEQQEILPKKKPQKQKKRGRRL